MDVNHDLHLTSCSMHPQLDLLGLPLAWLLHVVRQLDPASRLALFATCKTLKDLVLDSADSTSLSLQPVDLKQQQMMKALELVHQHAREVSLCMQGWQQGSQVVRRDENGRLHAVALTLRSCDLLHQAQHMGYLDCVTSLHFVNVELATPLMPGFGESCPNLTALTLQDSKITWAGLPVGNPRAAFSKLRVLSLHNVICWRPTEACKLWLQKQITQLTALRIHLRQDSSSLSPHVPRLSFYTSIAAAFTPATAGQVSQLTLPACQVPIPATWQWGFSHLVNVQQLHLDRTILDDVLMQQLLPLPNLTSASVQRINLRQSYRGQACRWLQLILRGRDLGLDDFASLPLHRNLQLQSSTALSPVRIQGLGMGAIKENKHKIITSKWGGWAGAYVELTLHSTDEEGHEQLLQLLDGVRCLHSACYDGNGRLCLHTEAGGCFRFIIQV